MFPVLLLHLEYLVSRLLTKQFDRQLLVTHRDFTLTAQASAKQSVSHTSRSVFFFLDASHYLRTTLYVNLSGLNNFL